MSSSYYLKNNNVDMYGGYIISKINYENNLIYAKQRHMLNEKENS